MKLLLILVFVVSCATAKKQAIKLSEQGLHEAAIPMWVEALKKDPDDIEAQTGLLISQEHAMNERLVKIRDLRMANSYEEAITQLDQLIAVQKQWNVKLDFNSSSFQGNEVTALWPYQKQTIASLISKKQPLAADWRLLKYKVIFESKGDFGEVRNNIINAGNLRCKYLRSHANDKPFYNSFSSKFCNYFQPGREISSSNSKIPDVLFNNLKVKTSIKGINKELDDNLQTSVQGTFQDSVWFNAESKKTGQADVTGEYQWRPYSQKIAQVHSYNVQIPYTAYEPVMRSKQVPYSTTEYRCVYTYGYGQTCGNVAVTNYRTEYYWENEAVTRYRTETRAYNYYATKNSQELFINFKGKVIIGNDVITFTFVKHDSEEKIVHDISMPEIGLSPKTEDVSSPIEKFKEYSVLLSDGIKTEVDKAWEKKFCSSPKKRDLASEGENALRCRKIKKSGNPFVESWFNNNFGIESTEVETLIGMF